LRLAALAGLTLVLAGAGVIGFGLLPDAIHGAVPQVGLAAALVGAWVAANALLGIGALQVIGELKLLRTRPDDADSGSDEDG
jgi:hypothetical protein